MILETRCPSCNAPTVATFDDVTEADAALLATRLYCAPCAALRVRLGASVAPDHAKTLPASQDAPESKDGGMGELLRETERAKGAKGNPGGRGAKIVQSPDVTAQPTLAELGITKNESSKAGG